MTTKDEQLAGLLETKDSIQNNNFDPDKVKDLLKRMDSILLDKSLNIADQKSNLIKSFLITFNINNFSDFTVLFIASDDDSRLIEYAGNELILNEFQNLIQADNKFYKEIDRIKFKENSFRIFFESMENDNGVYTVLTVTESVFFKPSKFHMLCDILMDIIRSTDKSRGSIFNDLLIGIQSISFNKSFTLSGSKLLFCIESFISSRPANCSFLVVINYPMISNLNQNIFLIFLQQDCIF